MNKSQKMFVVSIIASCFSIGCTVECKNCLLGDAPDTGSMVVDRPMPTADTMPMNDTPATTDTAPADTSRTDATASDVPTIVDARVCVPGSVEWDCVVLVACGTHATSRTCTANGEWGECLIQSRCITDAGTPPTDSGVTQTDAGTPTDSGGTTPPATDLYELTLTTENAEAANEIHAEQWVAGIGDTMPPGSHANVGDPGRMPPLMTHTTAFRITRCALPDFQGRFVFPAVTPSRRQTTVWSCMRFYNFSDGRFEQYGSIIARRNGIPVTLDAVDNRRMGCNMRPRHDPTCP